MEPMRPPEARPRSVCGRAPPALRPSDTKHHSLGAKILLTKSAEESWHGWKQVIRGPKSADRVYVTAMADE